MNALPIILVALPLAALANVPSGGIAAGSSAAAGWTPPPFERYQPIVDSKPFGSPPAPLAPPPQAVPAGPPPLPPFVNKLILCAINRTPAGPVAVGFVDGNQNPPRSYYLVKGESADGFTVLEANFESETTVLEKDGVRIELSMRKGPVVNAMTVPTVLARAEPPVSNPPAPAPIPRFAPAMVVQPADTAHVARLNAGPPVVPTFFDPAKPETWQVPNSVKAIDKALSMGIQQESYVERLKKRKEEILAQQAALDAANKEKLDKAVEERATISIERNLRLMNLQSIRTGGGGLGIPLTAEEDAQLVAEGVLPARK